MVVKFINYILVNVNPYYYFINYRKIINYLEVVDYVHVVLEYFIIQILFIIYQSYLHQLELNKFNQNFNINH